MKILFIVSWYSAFNAPVICEGIFHYEQVCALKKYADTEVAIYFPFDTSIKNDFSDDIEHGIRVFRRRRAFNKIKRCIDYFSDYKSIKKKFNPDVIHAHVAGGAGKISFFWKKVYRVPYLLTEHSPVELMCLENKKNFVTHKFVYKNSFSNICVSKDLCSKLRAYFPRQVFDVIYNGILYVMEHAVYIDRQHKINCAIAASFYDKDIKGFQFLLPAIKEVSENGIDICLHICGGGEYLDFYKHLASELGIMDSCIFYGQVEKTKVYSIVSQMDFVVFASLFESAGVFVEEAMLLGKPLVVTNSGGASSLVTEDTAIVVDKGSTESLVKGIMDMTVRYKEYDSEKIKKYALDNFGMDSVCKKYMNLYTECIRKKRKKI